MDITVPSWKKAGIVSFGIISSLLTVLSGPTYAQSNYIDFEVGMGFLKVPEQQFFANRGTSGRFRRLSNLHTDDGQGTGVALGGGIGHVFADPFLGADASRLELKGFYIDQENGMDATFVDGGSSDRYGWVRIDGSLGFGTPSTGSTLTTSVQHHNHYGSWDVLLNQDFIVESNRRWTLYGGFSAQHLYQDINTSGGIRTISVSLQEHLNTDYWGGKLGIAYEFDLNSQWSIQTDAAVGLYRANSRYHGDYTDSGIGNPSISRSDTNDEFAVSPQLKFNLTRQITENSYLSVYTNLVYTSYAPQIQYGAIGSPTPPGGVPKIVDGDLFATMVGLNYTILR